MFEEVVDMDTIEDLPESVVNELLAILTKAGY